MEKITITFKNGAEIEADKNGDCYIVDTKPVFPSDLSEVNVGDAKLKNVQIIECASVDGRYWFALREMSETEMWRASIEDALCELSMEE